MSADALSLPFAEPHAAPDEITAVSWNLHKGRSPLGFTAWNAMRNWMQSTHADVYFLQEAMARRMPRPMLAPGFGAPMEEAGDDVWHCQATEIAQALDWQIALGPNVFKPSWRHGNAILSPHPLDLSGRWDISAHRFEKRGLLVAPPNDPISSIMTTNLITINEHLDQEEATRIFKESDVARDWFGDDFVEHFAATREWEWRQWQDAVTDWERKRYFEII